MKNLNIKKILLLSLIVSILITIISPLNINAAELNKISVYVDLLENGDGLVKMVWDYEDDEGTEHYIPILGRGISISDLQVSKNNVEYEILDDWDINASREEKKNKAGLIFDGENYEVCWGIGDYGHNEFTVSYVVEDIIKNLQDAQMLHYRFINDNLSEPPRDMYIEINGFKDFTKDDILMWAFGFDGEIQLENGVVKAVSFSPLSTSDYAHILLKFNPGYFNANPDSSVDMTFDEVQDLAFDGSDYIDYGDEEYNNSNDYYDDNGGFGTMIPFLFLPIILFFASFKIKNLSEKSKVMINQSQYKGQYYREIPYKGDPVNLYFIMKSIYGIQYENYTTYFFLKWIKNGNLEKFNYEKGVIFKKEKTGFKIVKSPEDSSSIESTLFNFLVQASGTDRMLQENEFNTWMSSNYDKFENYIISLDSNSEDTLLKEGYLKYEKRKVLFWNVDKLVLSDTGNELAGNIIKFKNYLTDFSLLNERDSINIHIWDDFMLYAAIFGITDVVEKEFNKLYPNYFEQTNIDMSTIYISNYYARSIRNSYTTNSASSVAASSGFGGGSSFGGGGGGFGGGSGGGTR